MTLSTRRKLALARVAFHTIMGCRRLAGRDAGAAVKRHGINWRLDLDEGIDFAIYLTGAFEPRTIAAYTRVLSPGDIVVDIGANMGAHTLPLARCVGSAGRVFAFEPAVTAFARLKSNIAANPDLATRIIARQTMLVDRDGTAAEPEVYASWPLRPNQDAHDLHQGIMVSTSGASALSLDAALAVEGAAPVSLIKLDVDGHEIDVLEGARHTLQSHRPRIVMEMAPYTLEERGRSIGELLAVLGDFGYRLFDLAGRPLAQGADPFTVDLAPGTSINVVAET